MSTQSDDSGSVTTSDQETTPVTQTPTSQPISPTPSPAPSPTQSTQSQTQSQPAHTSQSPSFGEVMTVLEAMPEKLVNAIREATQPAKAPKQPPESRSNAGAPAESDTAVKTDSVKTPGKKSFGQRWFGV